MSKLQPAEGPIAYLDHVAFNLATFQNEPVELKIDEIDRIFLNICRETYKDNPAPNIESFKFIKSSSSKTVLCYFNGETDSVVFGCRGTKTKYDILTDKNIATNTLAKTLRFKSDLKFVIAQLAKFDSADKSLTEITFTGHSLGGAIATQMVIKLSQVDVKTPPESRVRITSGNYPDGSNVSNGKGMLVRTTPHKAIVLLDEGRGEVALNFASVELDLGSADNRAPPSGETVMKRQKAVPRPSSPEELAYFKEWNDTYGKKLTEAEHNEKEYPKTNNVNKTGFHLRQSFIFKGHENSFKLWYKRELKAKGGKSWKQLPRQRKRGLMGRWGAFMDKLYGPIHNYSGQDYFLYFEFKK